MIILTQYYYCGVIIISVMTVTITKVIVTGMVVFI